MRIESLGKSSMGDEKRVVSRMVARPIGEGLDLRGSGRGRFLESVNLLQQTGAGPRLEQRGFKQVYQSPALGDMIGMTIYELENEQGRQRATLFGLSSSATAATAVPTGVALESWVNGSKAHELINVEDGRLTRYELNEFS